MKYRDLEPIGQGETGELYKAYDPLLERPVALKFLRRDDAMMTARLLREARAQAKIDHDNVCKIYEVGDHQGRPFIAMQWIDGVELGTAALTMALPEKVKVVRDLARALHAAHDHGLVHRDLKPANVMVERLAGGASKPYVVDFGLVQEVELPGMTRTGQVLGTPSYMSPEQAQGDVRRIDRRSDIWSLGATFYELATGRTPFAGSSVVEVLMRILNEEPTPPRRLALDLPQDLEVVILKCLEKEPDRRYATAEELARELDRWLDGSPIEARRTAVGYRLLRRVQRHRIAAGLGLLAVLLLLSLSVLAWQVRLDAADAQQYAEEARDLEWMIRVLHTTPNQNVAAEREKVRRRMQELASELPELGRLGAGPAHYALGQGYLQLFDEERARGHLLEAWELGYRTPEVAYALGLVYGRLYEREGALGPGAEEGTTDPLAERPTLAELRQAAVSYLKLSRDAKNLPPEYLESLLHFYDDRFDEALAALQPVFARSPWFYEAQILEASVLYARSKRQWALLPADAAQKSFEEVDDAFERAIATAPSASAAHEGLCQLWTTWSVHQLYVGTGAAGQADLARSTELCQRATEVDPEIAEPWMYLARAYNTFAVVERERGEDFETPLAKAEQAARRAVALAGTDPIALNYLGDVLVQRAQHLQLFAGLDPSAALAEAEGIYRRVLDARPFEPKALGGLGNTLVARADWQESRGESALQVLREAVHYLEKAREISPDDEPTAFNLGAANLKLAEALAARGSDPMPALRAAEAAARASLALSPRDTWTMRLLATVLANLACFSLDAGGEPGDLLTEAHELLAADAATGGDTPDQRISLAEHWRAVAYVEQRRGGTPEPALARARALLTTDGVPEDLHGWFAEIRTGLELAAAQWALERGDSPAAALAGAEAAIAEIELEEMDLWEVEAFWAALHTFRALERTSRGEDAGDEIANGFERTRLYAAQRGFAAEPLLLAGLLHLAQARTLSQPARSAAASEAIVSLETAERRDAWLTPEIAPWLAAARAVVAEGAGPIQQAKELPAAPRQGGG